MGDGMIDMVNEKNGKSGYRGENYEDFWKEVLGCTARIGGGDVGGGRGRFRGLLSSRCHCCFGGWSEKGKDGDGRCTLRRLTKLEFECLGRA